MKCAENLTAYGLLKSLNGCITFFFFVNLQHLLDIAMRDTWCAQQQEVAYQSHGGVMVMLIVWMDLMNHPVAVSKQ